MNKRPPLITFITYNRMGNMIMSLKSLLDVSDDFELYIIDNGSRDKTWEYLQTVKDPRIKLKHRFNDNMGGAVALNFGLSKREKGQDYINFEYDCVTDVKNLVSVFQECGKEIPNAMFSGLIPNLLTPAFPVTNVGNTIFYPTPVMGFCLYIPASIIDKLMFYDEETALQDQEICARALFIGAKVGYLANAKCHLIGIDCVACKSFQSVCKGTDADICTKPYSRVTTAWYDKYRVESVARAAEKRQLGEITCGTQHIPDSLSEQALKKSLEHSKFFTDTYNANLKQAGLL